MSAEDYVDFDQMDPYEWEFSRYPSKGPTPARCRFCQKWGPWKRTGRYPNYKWFIDHDCTPVTIDDFQDLTTTP